MRLAITLLVPSLCLLAQVPAPLTLAEARRLSLANNPQLAAARYTAAAAYQLPNQYRAGYAPALTGGFTSVGADNGSRLAAGGLNNPVVYNRVGSGLSVNQLVTDFGRTGNLVRMARLRAEAQDEVTDRNRAQILLDTTRAFFALLRAQAVVTVATRTVEARRLIVDQVSALASSQLKSTLDVSFAKVNLSDARLLLAQAQNDLQAAGAELGRAMGLPSQTSFTVQDEPLPDPLPDQVAGLLRQALQDRPELKELRLRQTADERFARAEHAGWFPSVSVVGSAGFVPTGYETVPGRYGAIGLNVSIPIFNGGLVKARQAAAELTARATNSTLSDFENRVARDVRVAWLNANAAFDRMSLTAELLQQAQLALDLAQSRYDLGLSSIIELSQAQLNLTSAQIANSTAKYDYQAQRAVVDYQTGVLR